LSRTRTDFRLTFAVLCAGVMVFSLLQSMVNPVLPTIQAALDTDQRTVTWLLTAYLLSASVFTPIIGRIGDKVGKERMLVAALGALAVGSLIAALAPTIEVLILARVVQGVGGGVLPLTFGIIRDEFPSDRVAGAIGTAAALLAVGGALGLVVAGPLVAALSYHWLFWLPMLLTTVAGVAAWLFVPASPVRTEGRIDVRAAVLLSGWLVCLLLPVSQGRDWGWTSPLSLGLLAASALLCALWVRTEVRSDAPLIDMRMMRIPAVWTTNLVSLLFGVGMYAGYAFLPQFLQTPERAGYGFGASVTVSGLLLLPSRWRPSSPGCCPGASPRGTARSTCSSWAPACPRSRSSPSRWCTTRPGRSWPRRCSVGRPSAWPSPPCRTSSSKPSPARRPVSRAA
jgi:MFS family permease